MKVDAGEEHNSAAWKQMQMNNIHTHEDDHQRLSMYVFGLHIHLLAVHKHAATRIRFVAGDSSKLDTGLCDGKRSAHADQHGHADCRCCVDPSHLHMCIFFF